MNASKMRVPLPGVLALTLTFLMPAIVAGQDPAPAAAAGPATEPAPAAEDVRVTLASLSLAVDAETGELRPLTRQEIDELRRQMRELFPRRELGDPTLHANGMLSGLIAPNNLSFSVIRKQNDGSVRRECADGRRAALDFLTSTAAGRQQPGREEK